MTVEELIENFELLSDWEERYSYIIDLGKKLPPMDASLKNERTKVHGCVSNVWLVSSTGGDSPPTLHFLVDSDAFIVRGLAAMLLMIYSGKTPEEILAVDSHEVFDALGLESHLSPSRANGLHAMVERIRAEAGASAHPPS